MSENNSAVTVTLKGGVGYEAPWIVIHANTEAEALARVNDVTFANLAARTAEAASFFRGAVTGKNGFPDAKLEVQQDAAPAWAPPPAAQPQQAFAQAAVQNPPPVQQAAGEMCVHGAMKYNTSKPGAAKAWQAYFCPQPKGSAQCDPVWVR